MTSSPGPWFDASFPVRVIEPVPTPAMVSLSALGPLPIVTASPTWKPAADSTGSVALPDSAPGAVTDVSRKPGTSASTPTTVQ
jgi:hypothetical protein